MNEMLQIILDTTTRIFEDRCNRDVLEKAEAGEWPARLWEDVTAAGITLALLPEEHGGAGLNFDDALAVVRMAGYHGVPIPLAETMITARILADTGLEVPDAPLSFAPCEPGRELKAERAGGAWRVSGSCRRVPWGRRSAGVIAAVATEDGERLICLNPERTEITSGANLAFEPRDNLRVDAMTLSDEAFVAWPGGSSALFALGALIRAQQLAGAMQRALDLSTRYAGERVQFGRPLAKFQAIQQQLAVMAGQVAAANAGADTAAQSWGTDKREFAVAVAKSRAGEAAGEVAAIAHQVHGAMGFTREHSLHYTTRRLWSWRDEFGGETLWQRRLGRQTLDMGADELWPFLVGDPQPNKEAWPQ